MLLPSPVLSTRKVFFLGLLIALFLLIGTVAKSAYSGAQSALQAPPNGTMLSPRALLAAPKVAAVQAVQSLLVLHLEGNLTGEQSETPTQSSSVLFQPGISGQGVVVDRNSRLTYTSNGNIDATAGTIEIWLKPSWNGNDGQSRTILKYGNNGGMLLGKEGNNLRLSFNRSSDDGSLELDVLTSIQDWTQGQWHHVAASWSNSEKFLRLYVDGTLMSERSLATTTTLPTIDNITNSTLQIGGDGIRTPLLATIDEVVISSGPRTSQEIAARMIQNLAITSVTLPPPSPSVRLYPGWSYWKDLRFSAVTSNAGDISLPFLAAAISSTPSGIAETDSTTGRIKAIAPGTTTVRATLNGLSFDIGVEVLTPKKEPQTEEFIDAALSTPINNAVYSIPVAIIRYLPAKDDVDVDESLSGFASSLSALQNKQRILETNLKFMLEEGSRFRAYRNGAVVPSLGYRVVKIINVYEEVPPGLPTGTPEQYYPDYKQIFARFNVESMVNTDGVKEVWLEQYVNSNIALNESNMASPFSGDISSSAQTNDDLPVYPKSYTVFGIDFTRSENLAARNHGHHIEAVLTYANIRQDRDDLLFQEAFIGRNTDGSFLQGRCGKTNQPPNTTMAFEFNDPSLFESDIADWTPDGTGVIAFVNGDTWGSRSYSWPTPPSNPVECQWYIYWMQSIPGLNNAIKRFDSEELTNWWAFIGNWDTAIPTKLGLTKTINCQYVLSTTSQSISNSGGVSSIDITVGTGCTWTATSNDAWITINAGSASGSGNGTVNFTVAANTGGTRIGTLTIAGQTVTITQASNNPAPTLASIEPATVTAGSAAFSLTLNGTGFVATSAAQVNGISRTTTVVSSTQLTIAMTAADIANAGTLSIAVVTPAPGGGTSETRTLTINNPAPTLTSLGQTSATRGSSDLILTVNGSNFISSSIVRWNGANRTTTVVNASQLTATIPATDLANAGTASVTVFNPTPGGGTSSAATFTINNPTPAITSLAPNTTGAGGNAFSLIVNGTGFLSNSIVRWNGTDRTTTFGSSTQLTASITAADVAAAGNANVTVFNPTPGGGTSNASTFTTTSTCSFSISPTAQSFAATGSGSSVNVTTATGCAWTSISNDTWITINAGSGSGNGSGVVNFAVAANTGAARTGTLTIAGITFTVTQDATQSTCIAQRTLPTQYTPGVAFQVSVQVTPSASTQSYAVEETPPTGWTVSAIDNNGQFDSVNGKVKWGPFFDATARTFLYSVTPPVGTTGQRTFGGTASLNGTSNTICGNTTIEAANLFHPADLNTNLRIEINELTAYGAAWKAGTAPIDINYLTNAGLIWKLGEIYHYDGSKSPPFAAGASISLRQSDLPTSTEKIASFATEEQALKMLRAMGYAPGLGFGMVAAIDAMMEASSTAFAGGTAAASFSAASYTPGVGITVTINVTPDASTQVYAIEETVPPGWTVTSINNGGAFDNTNRKVKWGPYFDNAARSLTYVITPPSGETGNKTFMGSVSFDGVSFSVSGSRTLSPASSCTYALGATSQSVAATGGTGSFTITTQTGCTWNASTSDGWITFTQGNGSGNGSVNYAVAANAGAARSGTIFVGGRTFTINQAANAAPTITPAAALTRQQGATANAVTIATISDTETAATNLVVTTTSVPTGLSVAGITNTNGTISAIITADCSATVGANTIALKVTDAQGATAQANLTVNVAANTSCFLQIADTSGSDQRAGSVLLYSYYTSNLGNRAAENTQIRLTNTHDTQDTTVRLYFVDGQTASVFSLFYCLPANQTISLLMSETDPNITGYVIAVAVDKTTGCPVNFNHLAGSASVKLASGHITNLGAVAVAALATNPTTCATGNTSTTLNFDGTSYGRLPRLVVVDNLPSLKDGNNTRLILTRVGGSLVGTAGGLGAISGKIYNGNRTAQDFSFSSSAPQFVSSLSNTFPRLTTRFDTFIPAGQTGWMKAWTDSSWGIIGSVMNLPANLRTPNAFVGGYNLQHGALAGAVSLTVPISAPTCQ
ncbi:MAG: hypothetical protein JNM09_04795 [Blastocatellia bacterium]|nr:hypothetical protein [Blastocatellia bacterium]